MMGRRLIVTALLGAVVTALSACGPQKRLPEPALEEATARRYLTGRWEWVRSCGFSGGCFTPEDSRMRRSIAFIAGGRFVEVVDGDTTSDTTYTLYREIVTEPPAAVVVDIPGYRTRWIVTYISADSLVLTDLCPNCGIHHYRRAGGSGAVTSD